MDASVSHPGLQACSPNPWAGPENCPFWLFPTEMQRCWPGPVLQVVPIQITLIQALSSFCSQGFFHHIPAEKLAAKVSVYACLLQTVTTLLGNGMCMVEGGFFLSLGKIRPR